MQLLTFLLNGVKFGIPVNDVESIETRMNVVNIPNSLPQVHGIMNLHGEVIAVYSLAEQFHYPEQEINNIIVASMNGTKIGLEVGNVDEIIDVPDEKVISMPVIMKAVENCFDEVASYAKELIVLIEVSKLMPEPEQAGKCNKNQDYISDKSSCMDSKSFFQIFIFVHNNTSPFYSTHAFLLSFPVTLKTIRLKIAVMMNRITDTAPAIP